MINVWSSETGQSLCLHNEEDSPKVVITPEKLSGLNFTESNIKNYCLILEEKSKVDWGQLYTCVHYTGDAEIAAGTNAYLYKETSRYEFYNLADINFEKFMTQGITIYGKETTYLYSVVLERINSKNDITGIYTTVKDGMCELEGVNGSKFSSVNDIIEIRVTLGEEDVVNSSKCKVVLTGYNSSYAGWQQVSSQEGSLVLRTTVGALLKANSWSDLSDLAGTRFTVSGLDVGKTFDYSIKLITTE